MLRPMRLMSMAGPRLRSAKAGSVASFCDTSPNRLNFIVRFTMAPSSYLLVTAIPPGEAPLWVREKWVGIELPLKQRSLSPRTFPAAGVLTGPRGFLSSLAAWLSGNLMRQEGYLVDALAAVEALEAVHPEAAAWWRKNTPHLMRANRRFIFQKDVGHVVRRNEPKL